jgi:hypothetical protein
MHACEFKPYRLCEKNEMDVVWQFWGIYIESTLGNQVNEAYISFVSILFFLNFEVVHVWYM